MTNPIHGRRGHQRFTATPSRFSAARRWLALGLFALAATNVLAETEHHDERCSSGADADAVVKQRAAFNEAILREDPDTIAAVLADDALLITGSDSDVFRGRDAQVALWVTDFADPDRLVYVRTPDCIDVSAGYPIALEHGRWRGEPEAEDAEGAFFSGRYSAKWRHDGTTWRLEAELYMTDDCGGSICPEDKHTP